MNKLEEYFYTHRKNIVHKWTHYFEIYDTHFNRYIDKECVILEIGVAMGGSLQMWRHYFGNKAKIFGIDININCKNFKEENIEIAINLAEIVLDIYEKQYPEDKRIRDCITAAKSYLKKQITVVRLCKVKYAANTAANTAAYATAAAASAADAAASAADAAAVAYAADATADTAAYAAANAAVVAADATADTATTLSDTFSTQLFKVFINYCKTH